MTCHRHGHRPHSHHRGHEIVSADSKTMKRPSSSSSTTAPSSPSSSSSHARRTVSALSVGLGLGLGLGLSAGTSGVAAAAPATPSSSLRDGENLDRNAHRQRRHLASSAAAAFAHYTPAKIRNAIPLDLKLHPSTGEVFVETPTGELVEYHGDSLFGKAGDFADALDGEPTKNEKKTTKRGTDLADDTDPESVVALSAIMAPSQANDIHVQSTRASRKKAAFDFLMEEVLREKEEFVEETKRLEGQAKRHDDDGDRERKIAEDEATEQDEEEEEGEQPESVRLRGRTRRTRRISEKNRSDGEPTDLEAEEHEMSNELTELEVEPVPSSTMVLNLDYIYFQHLRQPQSEQEHLEQSEQHSPPSSSSSFEFGVQTEEDVASRMEDVEQDADASEDVDEEFFDAISELEDQVEQVVGEDDQDSDDVEDAGTESDMETTRSLEGRDKTFTIVPRGNKNKNNNKNNNKNKNKNKNNNNNNKNKDKKDKSNNTKRPVRIKSLTPDKGSTIQSQQTFSAKVKAPNNSQVRTVQFQLTDPSGDKSNWLNVPRANNGGGDTFSITVDGFQKYRGTRWTYRMKATDTNGNSVESNSILFKVDGLGDSANDFGGGGANSGVDKAPPAPSPPSSYSNSRPMPQSTVQDSNWPYDGPIQSATGRILFEFTGTSTFVCSGTVIDDGSNNNGRSIIVTAAHCAYSDVTKEFAKLAVFIPDQVSTRGEKSDFDCGNDKYGCWYLSFAVVERGWAENSFPANVQYDYAYYVVTDSPSTHSRGYSSGLTSTLDKDVTPMSIDFSTNQINDQTVALGYSADKDPAFRYCSMDTETISGVPWYTNLWLSHCGMSGGASGGPWIRDMTQEGMGTVVSVNSWGFSDKVGMAGPVFRTGSGSFAECLYDKALKADDPGSAGGIVVDC
ncbi:hypothetical protein ACHAXS_004014 [Conticribra weissflogii]